jgi:hypothetical protein
VIVGTFVYSPEVIVRIATDKDTYDVSSDVSSLSVSRRNKGVSSFTLTLSNARRKYEGLFAPMDRIAIYMRRIGPPLLVFTGYLDGVPAFSTYSQSVRLRGSCTLKRLQHWYWDPGTQAAGLLLAPQTGVDHDEKGVMDGGLARKAVDLINKVTGWPREMIHIGAVPDQWFKDVSEIASETISEAVQAQMVAEVGGMGYLHGTSSGSGVATQGLRQLPGDGPGTGTIPNEIASIGVFGGSNSHPGVMSLTGEPLQISDSEREAWGGKYYVQGRWPYRRSDGTLEEGVNLSRAEAWWKNRKMLLVNPRTNKAVVVRAAHWGPAKGSATSMNVSRAAWDALGAKPGHTVHVAFAPESMKLGPQASTASASAATVAKSFPNIVETVSQNIATMAAYGRPPTGTTIGSTFAQLEEFLAWLDARGYRVREHPKYGGVTPNSHLSISEGGYHHWPPPNGGGAADVTWPAGGEEANRMLDLAVREAAMRGLGIIWRSRGHWGHAHFDISTNRRIGNMVYATLDGTPPVKALDGSPGQVGTPGASSGSEQQMGVALFRAFTHVQDWMASGVSDILGGPRALMNDVPFLQTVGELLSAGLRDWCSAPNGDLIAWFPDYFGRFGTAARMVIEPIEILGDGFEVEWSDDRLKTHMFVTSSDDLGGSWINPPTTATSLHRMMTTAGIASVEFPELMKVLFGLDTKDFADGGKGFLSRFGARPDWKPMHAISGPQAEFFFSVYRFMQNWSQQYKASIEVSFMPEMFPGMIAVFPYYGVQAYVNGVTHTVDMTGDAGFNTTLELTAWSSIGNNPRNPIPGLPRGGELPK